MGKLIARSQRIGRELSDSEVIAVLTTATSRAELSEAEVEKAECDDVVVLAQEDLSELWNAAQAGETSAQVVRRFREQLLSAGSRVRSQRGVGLEEMLNA